MFGPAASAAVAAAAGAASAAVGGAATTADGAPAADVAPEPAVSAPVADTLRDRPLIQGLLIASFRKGSDICAVSDFGSRNPQHFKKAAETEVLSRLRQIDSAGEAQVHVLVVDGGDGAGDSRETQKAFFFISEASELWVFFTLSGLWSFNFFCFFSIALSRSGI